MINTKLARAIRIAKYWWQEGKKWKYSRMIFKKDGSRRRIRRRMNLPYSMRSPCAENLKMPVLSIRFDEPATFRTRPASSWIDLFNLSRRFFSARLRASRPLLLQVRKWIKKNKIKFLLKNLFFFFFLFMGIVNDLCAMKMLQIV